VSSYIHHVIRQNALKADKYFVNLVQNTIVRKNIDFDNSSGIEPDRDSTTPSPSFKSHQLLSQ
jgi:hypothetical protein